MINLKQAVKSKLIFGLLILSLLLTACSDTAVDNTAEYTTRIKELEEKVATLETQNNELKIEKDNLSGMHGNLQPADGESRRILSLIANGDFDTLKENYSLEFELNEAKNEITFDDGVMNRKLVLPIEFFDNDGNTIYYDMGFNGEDFYIMYDIHGNKDLNFTNFMKVTFKYDPYMNFKSMSLFEKVQ